MSLFTKSYQELSEAFVRSRFAESEAFGRADIEEWLAEQRNAVSPDVDVWRELLERDGITDMLEGNIINLLSNAESADYPFPPEDEWFKDLSPALQEVALSLFPMLGKEKVIVYRGMRQQIVIVDFLRKKLITLEVNSDEPQYCYVSACSSQSAIAEILLFTWTKGGERAPFACGVLCKMFERWIAHVRSDERSDFNRAVAVSADGTKIVHADEVWVIDGGRVISHHAASGFFQQKILRSERMERKNLDKTYLEGSLLLNIVEEYGQVLLTLPSGDCRVLVTLRNLCPDPLPEALPPRMAHLRPE